MKGPTTNQRIRFLQSAGMAFLIALISGAKSGRETPNQNDFYSTIASGVSEDDLHKADELRNKTIESIKALLQDKSVKGSRAFELHLRLGELYAERHDYLRDLELRKYEQTYQKWVDGGKNGKEPKLSEKASKAELVKAANAFRTLVTKFPNHKRTAAALFSLGKTLSRLGNENAILYFTRLTRDHRDSELVPDAYLAAAEYYFDKHQIDRAIDSYQAAMKFRDHRAYPYMVYKLGWSYFNATPKNADQAKEFSDKAVTAFKLVIKLSDRDKLAFGRLNLREEALKDLVMAWADAGEVETAWEYFKTLGETDYFYNLLETLGNIYAEQGKYDKGIAVFKRLTAEAPTRPTNPQNYAKRVSMTELAGNEKQVVKDLKEMRALYASESVWTSGNAKDAERIAEAKRLVETNIYRYGALFHQRGQKTKNKLLLTAAVALYDEFLSAFPESKNAYDIRYYLADLLFDFEKFESAAVHFTGVVDQNPKDGKFKKDAALNAVLAWDKADRAVKHEKIPKPGAVSEPLELPETKAKLIKSSDRFVQLFPDASEGDPMRYTAAQTNFNYGHYDEALKRFGEIVETRPKSDQAKYSLKFIFAYFSEKEDWSSLTQWARKFAANKNVIAAGHAPVISAGLKSALFQWALSYEKQKKYTTAAKSFVSFQNEFPADPNAAKALFNASVNYYRVGNVEEALKIAKNLIDTYPKSEVVPDVILTSAESHEALAQFPEAAALYEQYALQHPSRKDAATSLYNAALIRKGLEQKTESLALFSRFTTQYRSHELYPVCVYEKAKLHELQSQHREAVANYLAHANLMTGKDADSELYSRAKAAQIMLLKTDPQNGANLIRDIRSRLVAKNAPTAFDARRVIGETSFNNLEGSFARFQSMKISDAQRIEEQVQAKQGTMVRLAAGYQDLMKLGNGEYSVAALFRLGEMHENFAQTLFAAPTPPGASQLDIDRFKSEIEKVAFPLKEEAYRFYEMAFKRSREVETFSDWTKKTYGKMSELSPAKNPTVEEITTSPTYISHRLSYDKDIEQVAD
jgi:TolA-binding protein